MRGGIFNNTLLFSRIFLGGQGLDGGEIVMMGDLPVPPTRENPEVSNQNN